jgi:hypothetical protein
MFKSRYWTNISTTINNEIVEIIGSKEQSFTILQMPHIMSMVLKADVIKIDPSYL